MSHKTPPLPSPKTHHRKRRRKTRPKTDLLESNAARQPPLGNRALQRALAQRQAAASPTFNPLDPKVLAAAAHVVVTANETPVRNWLAANTDRLRLLTMGELVAQVRRSVVEAGRLADGEIQSLVQQWANENGVSIPPVSILGGGSAAPSVQIPDAVKKAFSIAIEGVDVVRLPSGRLNISAKGATAKLKRGDITLSWGGSLGIDIPMEGFQVAGTLDKDKWEITVSAPGESFVPDLSKLADVFQKAETAMRGMAEAATTLGKLEDFSKVKKAITPHVEPIKEAVDALVKTAKAPAVSAGVSISGPVDKSSGGTTVTATVTVRF